MDKLVDKFAIAIVQGLFSAGSEEVKAQARVKHYENLPLGEAIGAFAYDGAEMILKARKKKMKKRKKEKRKKEKKGHD